MGSALPAPTVSLSTLVSSLFISVFSSVEDKQRVANLTHIPKFLPEITIGAHEYDEKYYAYKSVCRERRSSFLFSLVNVCLWQHEVTRGCDK